MKSKQPTELSEYNGIIQTNVGTHGSCVRPAGDDLSGPCVRPVPYPQRKNMRAKFHDYSGGEYFVTICTRDKSHYFGHIANGEMFYTPIGDYCRIQLEQVKIHYPYAEIPLFVVMPNHLHAIICIDTPMETNRTHELGSYGVNRTQAPGPYGNSRTHEPCVPTVRTALSVVVGGLKRAITMFARRNNIEFGWQARYHDHIIRGVKDGNMVSEYIENNVIRWATDCFNL